MLSAASPIFVVILAHFFLTNERIHGSQGVGIIVGFVGVALIIGVTPGSFGEADLAGQLAMVAVSLSYAVGAVYARRIGPQDAPQLAMRQQLVAGFVALLVAIGLEQPWTVDPEPIAVVAIIGLAVWASAIPIWIYFRMLAHTKAITVSLVAYLIPAVAVILGALVLGEALESTQRSVLSWCSRVWQSRPDRAERGPHHRCRPVESSRTKPSTSPRRSSVRQRVVSRELRPYRRRRWRRFASIRPYEERRAASPANRSSRWDDPQNQQPDNQDT